MHDDMVRLNTSLGTSTSLVMCHEHRAMTPVRLKASDMSIRERLNNIHHTPKAVSVKTRGIESKIYANKKPAATSAMLSQHPSCPNPRS